MSKQASIIQKNENFLVAGMGLYTNQKQRNLP
jgi:hypothetical protein